MSGVRREWMDDANARQSHNAMYRLGWSAKKAHGVLCHKDETR